MYERLRKLAERAFAGERRNHTLQATALVNEAYMQLCGARVEWQNSSHFFALSARLMRRILVNHAEAHNAAKRGSGLTPVTLRDDAGSTDYDAATLLDLDNGLSLLASRDELAANVLELHHFGGLTYEQIAELVHRSPTTVKRKLKFARAWLQARLDGSS